MIQIDTNMPKSCYDCFLTYYTDDEERCCLTEECVTGEYSDRLESCPLKEVKEQTDGCERADTDSGKE